MVERCDVMAIGAHPDDVELGCGATVARLAGDGVRVGIVDVTAGEAGTRGDVAVRRGEAERAARALGAAWRICLGLPDGCLGDRDEWRVALVRVMRSARPRVVLAPHEGDPHPDHAATAALVRAAVFLANAGGVAPPAGPRHHVALVLNYPGPRQVLVPQLVVDVSAVYAAKRAALAMHASQFDPAAGVATHLASGHFLAAVEGRDRAAGSPIGCEFGEGFTTLGAASGDDVAWLLTPHRAAVRDNQP